VTLLGRIVGIEHHEIKVALTAFIYFFLLMTSYFILRPLRDTMGTIYGVAHLQELFSGTFLLSLVVAPIFAGLASRIRLASFLPWVYGFIAITLVVFYFLFRTVTNDRWIAAAFYVWVSTFNLLTISVFWSLMADIFSSDQAKRLFGFIAAGGTVGTICGPGVHTPVRRCARYQPMLLLISAAGFVITALSGALMEREKRRLVAADVNRRRRLPSITDSAAIRLMVSCCCSNHAIY
jgi:AAA family ATP:ADP antiporter